MSFSEKLIKLRKKNGLSQEELGYKLNVTRQTISKWELGQTTPEMDKLVSLSKIYGISLDELTGNEDNVDEETKQDDSVKSQDKKDDSKNKDMRKILIPLIIILVIIAIIFGIGKLIFANRVTNEIVGTNNEIVKESKGVFSFASNMIKDVIEKLGFNSKEVKDEIKNQIEEGKAEEKANKVKSYNLQFEIYSGTIQGNLVNKLLDKVVTNNKTEKDNIITVSYKEKETEMSDEIITIKGQFDSFNQYEVSLSYNEDGYVNKITIQDTGKNTIDEMQKKLQQIVQ